MAIGVADDKHDLSIRARIVGQTLAVSIMIFADQYIADLGNLFGCGNINLGWLAVPFTYISVPLIDMAGVMVRSIKKGQSPFKPDRDHLHHIFIRAGISSRQALIIITLVSAAITAMGIGLIYFGFPEWASLVGFLILFSVYIQIQNHIWRVVKALRSLTALQSLLSSRKS